MSLFLPELERELRAAIRARASLDAQPDRCQHDAPGAGARRRWASRRPSIGAAAVTVCSVLAVVIAGVLLVSLRSHHPTVPRPPAGSQRVPPGVRKLETKLAVLRRPQTAKDRSLGPLIARTVGRGSLASNLSGVITSLMRYTQTLPDGREVFLVVYRGIGGPGRLIRPPPGLAIIGLDILQPDGKRTPGSTDVGGGGGATLGSLYFEARHGPNGCDGNTLHNIVPDGIARIRWEFPSADFYGNRDAPVIVNVPVIQNVAIATIPGLISCAKPTSVTLFGASGQIISQIGGTHVPPRNPSVSQADVAAPIAVHALPGDGPFCGNDQGGLWYVCKPGEIPLAGTSPTIVLRVSFTARVAVRNASSGYFVSVKNPGNCGGSGGGLGHNVAVGTRVTLQQTLQTRCKGTFHGTVEYVPNIGAAGAGPLIGRTRKGVAVTVGTFTYQLTNLPGPTITTPNGTLDGTLGVCCDATGSTHESGTIVIHGADQTQRYIYPGRSGRFSVSLPPGRYRVAGGIPKLGWRLGRCHPVPGTGTSSSASPTVSVSSGRTTTISVLCQGQ